MMCPRKREVPPPLVRELAVQEEPIRVPVTVTCRVLDLCRQQYYRWLKDPVTERELAEAYRADALFDAHRDDPEFGYRLLADEAASEGEVMCERTAWKICSSNAWWSSFGKKRAKNGQVAGPARARGPGSPRLHRAGAQQAMADRLRRFAPPKPSTAPVRASCTCAWSRTPGSTASSATPQRGPRIDSRMKARLAVRALDNAVDARAAAGMAVAGCVVHSDRGSQFRSR